MPYVTWSGGSNAFLLLDDLALTFPEYGMTDCRPVSPICFRIYFDREVGIPSLTMQEGRCTWIEFRFH